MSDGGTEREDPGALPPKSPAGVARPSPLDPGVLRGASHRWDRTLDKTLRSALIPYGYTVTIWASGAYLVTNQGQPSWLEAFAFVAGAILAFAAISTISQRRGEGDGELVAADPVPIHPDSSHPILVAGLHIAAVGLAFGAAALVDAYLGNVAWFMGSFTVTIVYLGFSSFELALAVEMHRREIGLQRARVIVRRQRAVLRRVARRR